MKAVDWMKVTDYIVERIIEEGVTDIFGYPGGVICHFIDSATKYPEKIDVHINYHEQASAFAACGYAQESGKIGVAFVTSGPGATNLVTGIANAYFDSIPTIFFSGQVDTYSLKGNLPIRQRGFQETDVVSMVRGITKYAVRVDKTEDIKYELEKAIHIAKEGNPGPVLLDIPADVQRAEVDIAALKTFDAPISKKLDHHSVDAILECIRTARRPCLLVGNGVKQANCVSQIRELINKLEIPTVFSMPAFDTLPFDNEYNYGFVGANGHRYANFVLGKSDLIVCIGSRMDLKQVGNNREEFATQAKIVRIDIDKDNFSYPVHKNELQIQADIKEILPLLLSVSFELMKCTNEWNTICAEIKEKLYGYDDAEYTMLLREFGDSIPDNCSITLDVGQNEVWCAQQIRIKTNQNVHMSAGHGAMGYSLPAAIGTFYASHRPVVSFNGDGGVQMNIQELQFIVREQIPVHVVVMNNHALGMIRGFQEANFNGNFSQTIEGEGYLAPDFSRIAGAYGLQYKMIRNMNDAKLEGVDVNKPSIIEIAMPMETVLNPNFGRNGMIQDQRPYIDREIFEMLMRK